MKSMSETLKLRWPGTAEIDGADTARAASDGANRQSPLPGLEPTIYRFIMRHSLKQQIVLLLLTLVSFPFLYYSLDLPKTIVNRAIGGKNFPQQWFGFEFDQVPYLLALCGLFLVLVFVNGGLKILLHGH